MASIEAIEHIVANRAVAGEAEVPILVGIFQVHTKEEVGCGALAGIVAVALVDLTVGVEVIETILNRFAILVVTLLVSIEGVGCRANSVHLQVLTTGTGTGRVHKDCIVGIVVLVQLGEVGILEGTVETNTQALSCGADRVVVDRELNTLVTHRTYVGQKVGTKVRAHRYGYPVEQVFGVAAVDIDVTVDQATQNTEVYTEVVGSGGLPTDVRIVGRRSKHVRVDGVAVFVGTHVHHVREVVLREAVTSQELVVTNLLLTGRAIAQTYLQGREELLRLHKLLVEGVPSKSCRGEVAPTVALSKLRRTVGTHSQSQQIARVIRVVQTAIERHEVALLAAPNAGTLLILLVGLVVVGDAAVGAIKVLPRVTHHSVDVVQVASLVVVGIEVEHLVLTLPYFLGVFTKALSLRVPVCLYRANIHAIILLSFRPVATKVEVEAQSLKAVYLVVEGDVTQATIGACIFLYIVKHRKWVVGSQSVGSKILTTAITYVVVTIGGGVVDRAILVVPIGIDGGVVECCGTHCAAIGIVLVGINTLSVDVYGQVFVQIFGREVNVDGCTVEVRSLQSTLLGGVAHRSTIGKLIVNLVVGVVAIDAHVVVARQCGTENEALPIGVGLAHIFLGVLTSRRALCEGGVDVLAELFGTHNLHLVRVYRNAQRAVVRHAGFVATALLGGDDNNTIRCTRTIDCSSRSIFQYGERLDIVGVNQRQRVGHTRTGVACYGHTVDNNQRIVRCVQRSSTTDTDGRARVGAAIAGDDLQTGDFTLHHILSRYYCTTVEFLGLNSYNRAGKVVFFGNTITDDYDVVDHLGVFLQDYCGKRRRRSLIRLSLVADEANRNDRFGALDANGILAINIGGNTVCRTLFNNRGSDNRCSGSINYHTFNHVFALCKHLGGKCHCENSQSQTHSYELSHKVF